jgi:putative peptide zinc metalloprotease protein
MQESAFVTPPWLLEREGAGYVQVTELLYRIAEQSTGDQTVEDIAESITQSGKPVSAGTIRTLITQLLIPRGLIELADGSVVPVASGSLSPLALNMRMRMIGPDNVRPITNVLGVLFWPPVMFAILLIAGAAEVWLYAIHGIGAGMHDAIYAPGLMLVVLLVVVVSAGFHELGHATALHYAGGTIKGMGAGMYIVYPAFFTDVSDNYRLPRWQRVRTDLAGFYFNLIFALGIMGAYLLTGHEFLLLMVLMINLEIIHQLLPFLRLDGYWTLADITGVPDFFSQMTAFLRSALPVKAWKGRKLPELKPWAKVVFAVYTLTTIPLLLFLLFMMIQGVPRVLATAWDALGQQMQGFTTAQAQGDVFGGVGSIAQAFLLLIPTIGVCYTLFSLGRRLTVGLWNWGRPNAIRRAVSGVCFVGAAGLLGFMWVPQVPRPGAAPEAASPASIGPLSPVSWQPIGPQDRGTVQDVVHVSEPEMATPAPTPQTTEVVLATPEATPEATLAVPIRDAQTGGTLQPTVVATPQTRAVTTATTVTRAVATAPVATAAPTRSTPARVVATSTPASVRTPVTPTLPPGG